MNRGWRMSYSQKAIVGYETNFLFIRGFNDAGYGNSLFAE